MPRERIQRSQPHDGGGPDFHLEVGWDRDQDMRVGIVADGPLVRVLYGDEGTKAHVADVFAQNLRAAGWILAPDPDAQTGTALRDQTIAEVLIDTLAVSTPFGESLWVYPARAETNAFIRLLRKARDAAFGRDE